jgi:deazaflavin-dependent oxidoreductase (nitroreductase family)
VCGNFAANLDPIPETPIMTEKNASTELPSWITTHIQQYRDDPDKGHLWDSAAVGGPGLLPTLLLSTTGRKSGRTSLLPLIYKQVNNGFVIIASKGGAPAHPAWYLNLLANPDCQIQVAHDHYRVTARTAEGDERETLWQQLAEIYPPYNDYQAATTRKIPVVVLDPVS